MLRFDHFPKCFGFFVFVLNIARHAKPYGKRPHQLDRYVQGIQLLKGGQVLWTCTRRADDCLSGQLLDESIGFCSGNESVS